MLFYIIGSYFCEMKILAAATAEAPHSLITETIWSALPAPPDAIQVCLHFLRLVL